MTGARARAVFVDLAVLFAVREALSDYVLRAGFTHVSDDDYARVVIAERFAAHPALDPSGTSWLPFPFWLAGTVLRVVGPSLLVARLATYVVGIVSVAAPYAALRAVGSARATAIAGVALASCIPWSAWLGVATVPEAMTACLVSAGAVAVTAPRARLVAALALLAASLSRYEAWPACAVFAAACGLFSRREAELRARTLASAAVAVSGPAGWMLWNAHAHDGPLHFLARVANYRRAIGAADVSLAEKLTAFPRALFATAPALVTLSLLALIVLALDAGLRSRWLAPLASAAAILAFLVYGDVRDGAPTHHPERAVLPVLWILVPFGVDAWRTAARRVAWARPQREMWVVGATFAGALAWLALLPGELRDFPGEGPGEGREVQVTRGLSLHDHADSSAAYRITPCAYEHFALIAAEGHPDRFTILPATHDAGGQCPRVERL